MTTPHAPHTSNPAGPLFFEDLVVGEVHTTAGRTVTESDIVSFAGLSGDYNGLHVDAEYASTTQFGERVAHGLLVLSIASGLSTRLAFSEALAPNILGLLDLQCRWPRPTRIGDTIGVEVSIAECAATSRPGRGVLTLHRRVSNQHQIVVMESVWKLLIRSRAGQAEGTEK